jgi:hypothetical protein
MLMKTFCKVTLFIVAAVSVGFAQSNPVPFIEQIAPISVRPGHKGFDLTVTGSGFAADSVLHWNGAPRTTSIISQNLIKASISASDVSHVGTASLVVVSPSPGGGTSNVAYLPIRGSLATAALAPDMNLNALGQGVTADFNNDGKLDVAVAENQSNGQGLIAVSFGNGDGTFRSAVQTQTAFSPQSIFAADFNGDGIPDLAIGRDDYTISIFLGSGDGHFSLVSDNYPAYETPAAVGDFNGDGKIDLLTYTYGDQDVGLIIFLGNGDGTFKLGSSVADIYNASIPALGDFNHDGKLDIAIATLDSYEGAEVLDIFLGNGDGTFQKPVSYPNTYEYQPSTVLADVNRDDIPDLITNGICVFLGNPDGTFQQGQCLNTAAQQLATGDFNGDGKVDLVTLMEGGDILILLGNGDGTFQSPITIAEPFSYSSGFMIGDFNQDGKLDLLNTEDNYPNYQSVLYLQSPASAVPTNLSFGNQSVGVGSLPQSTTFTNITNKPLTIGSISIGGVNAADFSQTNNCPKTLPPNSSCQFQVTFTPTALGARSAFLNATFRGTNAAQSVPLSGIGVTITVSLAPSKLHFGTDLVNNSSPEQSVKLTSIGTYQVDIQSISTSGAFSQTNDCPSQLYPSYSCVIKVTFDPQQPGPNKGDLTVTDNATGSPQIVNLHGTGTVVELVPMGINFGTEQVGSKSSPVHVALTNTGSAVLHISQITFTGKDPADFQQTNNCGSSIPAGGRCTIKVVFAPTVKGYRQANLSVMDDGGGSPQNVELAGNGK